MSVASEVFAQSILDAENLLKHFNTLNIKPPPPEIEVLKRAGLIMAMTAWETFVEDRVLEAARLRLPDDTNRNDPGRIRHDSYRSRDCYEAACDAFYNSDSESVRSIRGMTNAMILLRL